MSAPATRWTRTPAGTYTRDGVTITNETGIAGLSIWVARDTTGTQVARTDTLAAFKAAASSAEPAVTYACHACDWTSRRPEESHRHRFTLGHVTFRTPAP